MNKRSAILAALLASATAGADDVYLCKKDGKTIYSGKPEGDTCQRLELKTSDPSPEELARQQQERLREETQRQVEETRDREERRVRAEEAAARAAERQAQAAEEQARYQRELKEAQEAGAGNNSSGPPIMFINPAPQYIPSRKQHAPSGIDIHIGKDQRPAPTGNAIPPMPGNNPAPDHAPSSP